MAKDRRLKRLKGYKGIARYEVLKDGYWVAESGSVVARKYCGGIQVNKSFPNLVEAIRWQTGEIKHGSGPLLGSVIRKWLSWVKPPRVGQSTYSLYKRKVDWMSDILEIPILDLTAQRLDNILIGWKKRIKYTGRRGFIHELKILRTCLNWYREYHDATYNHQILKRHFTDSMIRMSNKSLKYLTKPECYYFLDALRKHSLAIYFWLATFLLYTGLRVGEAAGLTWDAIFPKENKLIIKQIVWWDRAQSEGQFKPTSKTNKARIVIVAADVITLLNRWKQKSDDGFISDLVFRQPMSNKPLTYASIQNAFNRAFKLCGLPHRSCHILRHTFAVHHAEQTKDIRATQAALGHSDLKTTQHYAKLTENVQRNVIQKFELSLLQDSDYDS